MICSVTTKRTTGGWLANDEKGRAEPIVFPVHLDLLPGLLAAKVYFHDVDSPAGPVPCWTYVSDGLLGPGKEEFVFTLRRQKDQQSGDFPQDPVFFFTEHLSAGGARTASGCRGRD